MFAIVPLRFSKILNSSLCLTSHINRKNNKKWKRRKIGQSTISRGPYICDYYVMKEWSMVIKGENIQFKLKAAGSQVSRICKFYFACSEVSVLSS